MNATTEGIMSQGVHDDDLTDKCYTAHAKERASIRLVPSIDSDCFHTTTPSDDYRTETPELKRSNAVHKIPPLRHKRSPDLCTLREIRLRDVRSEEALRQAYEAQTLAYLESPLSAIGLDMDASDL